MALVECVPNFSEGRRKEVVDAILKAMRESGSVKILDSRSDPDHNRTVVTMVGEPTEVFDAAFAGIKKAAELIDMDQHKGEHPRIGATDVVPFVPISGIDLKGCIELARRLAEKVGRELGIPIYLYEAAASRPDRVDLANIRKGQYEGLKESIRSDPERKPDFGPSALPKAGATVIGARAFLIAYNIYLDTSDVDVAKSIAKSIRQKDGGFPYVKAMGFQTKPYVQVSINLNDFTKTPMHAVFEAVRKEAGRKGVKVIRSEVYGVVPANALFDAAEHYLQLTDGWERSQIIEKRLEELDAQSPTLRSMRMDKFLQTLASGSPTPGGGSAACLSGAMGAALGAMVSRLTLGKKGYESVQSLFEEKARLFDELRSKLTLAIDLDADAYEDVMKAFKLPKENEEERTLRTQRIQSAYKHAAEIPLVTVELCGKVIDELLVIGRKCNKNAVSDVAVGLQAAYSGMVGAALNVEINLSAIKDEGYKVRLRVRLNELQAGVKEKVEAGIDDIRHGI